MSAADEDTMPGAQDAGTSPRSGGPPDRPDGHDPRAGSAATGAIAADAANAADAADAAAKPNLVYTVAIDRPGGALPHRAMAKLLAVSLLKTFFSGEIVVFRSSAAPLFLVGREGLREEFVEGLDDEPCEAKFRVAERIDAARYAKILYLDVDCLAMDNIDGLFAGDADIRYAEERGKPVSGDPFNAFLSDAEMGLARNGSNAGTWVVRGERYAEVAEAWRRIQQSRPNRRLQWADQPAWNKLLLSGAFAGEPFAPGEVVFPALHDPDFHAWRRAPVCHFCGDMDAALKLEFMFGAFAMRFFGDAAPLLIDLLEM